MTNRARSEEENRFGGSKLGAGRGKISKSPLPCFSPMGIQLLIVQISYRDEGYIYVCMKLRHNVKDGQHSP